MSIEGTHEQDIETWHTFVFCNAISELLEALPGVARPISGELVQGIRNPAKYGKLQGWRNCNKECAWHGAKQRESKMGKTEICTKTKSSKERGTQQFGGDLWACKCGNNVYNDRIFAQCRWHTS